MENNRLSLNIVMNIFKYLLIVTIVCCAFCSCLCNNERKQSMRFQVVEIDLGQNNRNTFHVMRNDSISSTGWGTVRNNNSFSVYLCSSQKENTFYIDNKEQFILLDSVICRIKDAGKNAVIKNVNIRLSLFGINGIELSDRYQNTIWYNEDIGSWMSKHSNGDCSWCINHPFYIGIAEILKKYDYTIERIIIDADAYPFSTKEMKSKKWLPSSTFAPSEIWDVSISMKIENENSNTD